MVIVMVMVVVQMSRESSLTESGNGHRNWGLAEELTPS